MLKNQRGQSTAEYAILIAVVIAAVVGMQLYVKRGMQAKFKGVSDAYTQVGGDIGGVAGNQGVTIDITKSQYEPYYTAAGALTSTTTNSEQSTMAAGGTLTKSSIDNTTTRTGNQNQGVNNTDDNNWNNDFRN